jgi:phosphoribosylformylglycinamidine synthase
MVGILDDENIGSGVTFPEPNLDIILLGDTRDELGGSEWQQMSMPDALAKPPRVDLDRERALVELLLTLHQKKLLRSAHDVSNGGLAFALAESSMEGIGCHVELGSHTDDLDAVALLFSESQARAIVACRPEHRDEIHTRGTRAGIAATHIGRTVAGAFLIERNGATLIRTTTPELARIWRSAFALLLAGDSIDDVVRGIGEEADLIAR